MNNNTIILGIGNIGRKDDGLGWLFLDYLKKNKFDKKSNEKLKNIYKSIFKIKLKYKKLKRKKFLTK